MCNLAGVGPTRQLWHRPLRRYRNRLFFGKPFGGRRPASARLPTHSARSVTVQVRPEESTQVRPSERGRRVHRTGRHRGTSAAARPARGSSPAPDSTERRRACGCRRPPRQCRPCRRGVRRRASAGASTLRMDLPLRVVARSSSSGTMKPRPSVAAMRNLRLPDIGERHRRRRRPRRGRPSAGSARRRLARRGASRLQAYRPCHSSPRPGGGPSSR